MSLCNFAINLKQVVSNKDKLEKVIPQSEFIRNKPSRPCLATSSFSRKKIASTYATPPKPTHLMSRGSVLTVANSNVGRSPLSRYSVTAVSSVWGSIRGPIARDRPHAAAVMHASVAVFCFKLSSTIILNGAGFDDPGLVTN